MTVTAPQASVSPVTSLMFAAVTAAGHANVRGGSALAVGGVTSVTLVIVCVQETVQADAFEAV